MPSPFLRLAVAAAFLLAGSLARAGEPVPPAPWGALKAGSDTVGTCATDEISEIEACYLVRCEPQAGLVFAIRDPDLGAAGVRRVRLTVGRLRQEFALRGTAANERWARIKDVPALLPMLTSGTTWANLETTKATMPYGTGFDLTRAETSIEALVRRCRA